MLSRMGFHVYRLTDDDTPVVIISQGPLPPPVSWRLPPERVLVGVYETVDEARTAARELSRRRRLATPPELPAEGDRG
jgi:hypothetical protein